MVPEGEVVDHLVSHIDLLLSMASLLGIILSPVAAPDSRDQLSTWLNRGGTGRDTIPQLYDLSTDPGETHNLLAR